MAPHTGFDTDSIKQKARKDILNLLEGVSKAYPTLYSCLVIEAGTDSPAGSWKEKPGS